LTVTQAVPGGYRFFAWTGEFTFQPDGRLFFAREFPALVIISCNGVIRMKKFLVPVIAAALIFCAVGTVFAGGGAESSPLNTASGREASAKPPVAVPPGGAGMALLTGCTFLILAAQVCLIREIRLWRKGAFEAIKNTIFRASIEGAVIAGEPKADTAPPGSGDPAGAEEDWKKERAA
jgi:hypothetical protein